MFLLWWKIHKKVNFCVFFVMALQHCIFYMEKLLTIPQNLYMIIKDFIQKQVMIKRSTSQPQQREPFSGWKMALGSMMEGSFWTGQLNQGLNAVSEYRQTVSRPPRLVPVTGLKRSQNRVWQTRCSPRAEWRSNDSYFCMREKRRLPVLWKKGGTAWIRPL